MRCFVIGPIGNRFASEESVERRIYEESIQLWEDVIEPACKANELTPTRADQISEPGEIMDQIVRELRESDIVIADVTNANPNVMYELGLRHSTAKPTVQIGEHERLPFDIQSIRTIQFRRTRGGLIDARDELRRALQAAIQGRFIAARATRAWLDIPGEPEEDGEDAAAGSTHSTATDPGFLEVLADMEEALPEVLTALNTVNGITGEIGSLATRYTSRMQDSDRGGRGARAKLSIVLEFSKDLRPLVQELDSQAATLENRVKAASPGVDYLLDQVESGASDRASEETQTFLESITTMGTSAPGALAAVRLFRGTLDPIEGASSELRPTIRQLRRALDRVVDFFQYIEGWTSRAERLGTTAGGIDTGRRADQS